jgi:hypothetical protein
MHRARARGTDAGENRYLAPGCVASPDGSGRIATLDLPRPDEESHLAHLDLPKPEERTPSSRFGLTNPSEEIPFPQLDRTNRGEDGTLGSGEKIEPK